MKHAHLTIPQMIDRNNREVRRRRAGQSFDQWSMRLLVAATFTGGALVLAQILADRLF